MRSVSDTFKIWSNTSSLRSGREMSAFLATGYDTFQMSNLQTLFGSNNGMVDQGTNLTDDSASIDHRRQGTWLFSFWRRPANRRTGVQQLTEDCILCTLIIPLLFFFLVTLSAIVALYGSTVQDLGPNVSKILEADLVYVKDTGNVDQTGDGGKENAILHFRGSAVPMLYGFSKRPELDQEERLFCELSYELLPLTYQKLRIWLNKGSKLELKYDVLTDDSMYALIVILRGRKALDGWTSNPMNSRLPESWHRVHGSGSINFDVERDGQYFIVLGNLNDNYVEVEFKAQFHVKHYSTETADISCSLSDDFCGLNLLYPGFKFALLTTPNGEVGTSEKWTLKMVYGYRWIVSLMVIGFISVMILLSLKIVGQFFQLIFLHEQVEDVSTIGHLNEPLLATQEASSMQSELENVQVDGSETNGTISENEKKIHHNQICAICCNEPRNTFFHPCGHCVICYACSKRKLMEDIDVDSCPRVCSICGSQVKEVKRIFTV